MTDIAERLTPAGRRLLLEKRATRLPPPAERRKLRDDAGYSLEEMANSLGIAKATAHRWECVRRLPKERAEAYLALMDAWRDLIRDSGAPAPAAQPQK